MLKEKMPDLKVVIDLTFTTKYYNSRLLGCFDLKYVKIGTEGQKVPRPKVVDRLISCNFAFIEETILGNEIKESLCISKTFTNSS